MKIYKFKNTSIVVKHLYIYELIGIIVWIMYVALGELEWTNGILFIVTSILIIALVYKKTNFIIQLSNDGIKYNNKQIKYKDIVKIVGGEHFYIYYIKGSKRNMLKISIVDFKNNIHKYTFHQLI